ncbi:MAG: DUF2510 domain-containing protein, partial [Phycicoccus sp.]|nr:DUF2510 domain-containing protein [Phycicoccus sp.]
MKGFLTFLLSLFAVGWIVGAFLSVLLSSAGYLISFVLALFVAYFAIRGLKYPLICSSCGRPKSTSGGRPKSTSATSWNPVGIDGVPLATQPTGLTPLTSKDETGGRSAGWHPDPAKSALFRWWDGTAWTADVSLNGQGQPPTSVGTPAAPVVVMRVPPTGDAGGLLEFVELVDPTIDPSWVGRCITRVYASVGLMFMRDVATHLNDYPDEQLTGLNLIAWSPVNDGLARSADNKWDIDGGDLRAVFVQGIVLAQFEMDSESFRSGQSAVRALEALDLFAMLGAKGYPEESVPFFCLAAHCGYYTRRAGILPQALGLVTPSGGVVGSAVTTTPAAGSSSDG